MLLTKNILYYLTIFILFPLCGTNLYDYFGEKYDENENCKEEEEVTIKKLMDAHKKNNIGNCMKSTVKYPHIAHFACFSQLIHEIYKICEKKLITTLGKALYCQKRGVMHCCYDNVKCIHKPKQRKKAFKNGISKYTKYGLNILPDLWAFQYDFRICKKTLTPVDNKECAKACQEEETGDFATKCRENKNLFKCCIVQQNSKCDACNFCCILPVCMINGTDPEWREIKFNTNVTLTPEIDSSVKAVKIQKYMKNMTRSWKPKAEMQYLTSESFCIKTADQFSSAVDHFYNMAEFRNASTEKKMKAVTTYAMDKNAHHEIPKTRRLYATKKGPLILQKSYNFDKCYNLTPLDYKSGLNKCSKKCGKLEQSPFAKLCNKNKNSVFKCCIRRHTHTEIYEDLQRNIMKKNKKPVKRYCSGGKCMSCCVLSICTTLNSDKKIVNKMVRDSPYTGRYTGCIAVSKDGRPHALNMSQFKLAHTKDDLCNVEPILPAKINISKLCGEKRREKRKKDKSKRKRKCKHRRCTHISKKRRGGKSKNGRKKKRKEKSKHNFRRNYIGKITNSHNTNNSNRSANEPHGKEASYITQNT